MGVNVCILVSIKGLRSRCRPLAGTPHDAGVLIHFFSRVRMGLCLVPRDHGRDRRLIEALSMCARALGAWAPILSGRYYPSDSRGTAIPDAAAQSPALRYPPFLVIRCHARPSEKMQPWPTAWHCICSQRAESVCARAQENVQSCDALASGAQEMVLRSVGALGGRHHAMITVNHARTLHACRTEGVL